MTIMTETEKNGERYTTISVYPSTLSALAEVMPKSWNYDRCIKELTEMWRKQQGKVARSGKPSEDNQTG